jgi:hypothetical protein
MSGGNPSPQTGPRGPGDVARGGEEDAESGQAGRGRRCSSAFCDERPLPLEDLHPHDLAPLRRLASARALLTEIAGRCAAPTLDIAEFLWQWGLAEGEGGAADPAHGIGHSTRSRNLVQLRRCLANATHERLAYRHDRSSEQSRHAQGIRGHDRSWDPEPTSRPIDSSPHQK